MRKLCLILTVLYAFGANCSAQSLNIAENLLKDNSSTFDSGWGNWGDQGNYCGKSLESTDVLKGSQYARLTPKKEAPNGYDAQLKYNYSATQGTTYVFRLKAKKVSGNGTIKAIMQHNSGDYDQETFFEENVTGDWATYEGEVTVTRSDYDVIIINYGYCGDVLIDDIEFGVKTNNVTGVTLDKESASVKQGKTLTLTATVAPADATNKNVTWSSSDPSVATVSNGLVTGVATGTAEITATTLDGSHTESCTVTVTTSLPPRLIADFNDITSLDGIISANYASHDVKPTKKDNMYIELISDPDSNRKYVAVSDGSYKSEEYCTIKLPDGLNIKEYGILAFDICYPGGSTDADDPHESMTNKTIPISLIYNDGSKATQTVNLATIYTREFPASVWDTKMIGLNLANQDFTGASNFQIKIGPINSQRGIYYLDNIRIKENVYDEGFTQAEDFSGFWWKVENNTLYIRGNGVIPDYTNKQCPWAAQTQKIEHVDVGEGITRIGNCSVGNSENNNVDITLHSIPEYFGEYCLQKDINGNLTRTLHLELWDAEKPFIAKSKSENFPTFNTAKYYRNVTSNYSTVCLPFPVAAETVTEAGVELFDFTSIKKDGDQYTLEFSKHSDEMGMAAGQTYLIKKNNINGKLLNTDVTGAQFNLDPKVSTKTITGRDPAFSISMKGVFQPSVFGPNLGTEQDPEYTYGFKNEKFYMNSGNMSVRPMRGYFYGSQLYSEQQSGAKKMPKMFNFEIGPNIETHISSPDFIAEDFNIEAVYSPSGMKTDSLNKGLNIIRTSTGRVLKVMVK